MAKQSTTVKASELVGRNIFQMKNKTVYYEFLSKTGYILTNDVVGKYTLFELDMPAALLIFCFLGMAVKSYFLSFGVALAFYIIVELYFRLVFLKRLPEIRNFVCPKRDPIDVRFAKGMSKTRLTIIASLAFALAVMLVANNILIEYPPLYQVLNYVLAVAALGFFGLAIKSIIVKKKNNY